MADTKRDFHFCVWCDFYPRWKQVNFSELWMDLEGIQLAWRASRVENEIYAILGGNNERN